MIVASFAVLMRRSSENHNGHLAWYWWPIMLICAGFAVFTIIQAPQSAFALLAGLLVIGTGLYFVARRSQVAVVEPIFD